MVGVKTDKIERGTFYICGYLVETTATHNDKDISGLYEDFYSTNKETAISCLKDGKKGYRNI